MSKYGNRKTVFAGLTFDSKREAARYGELMVLERTGRIRGLQRQVKYELAPAVKFVGARRTKPALVYRADFTYWENDSHIVEDVKGVETTEFRINRHLMKSVHGIDIRIV